MIKLTLNTVFINGRYQVVEMIIYYRVINLYLIPECVDFCASHLTLQISIIL